MRVAFNRIQCNPRRHPRTGSARFGDPEYSSVILDSRSSLRLAENDGGEEDNTQHALGAEWTRQIGPKPEINPKKKTGAGPVW